MRHILTFINATLLGVFTTVTAFADVTGYATVSSPHNNDYFVAPYHLGTDVTATSSHSITISGGTIGVTYSIYYTLTLDIDGTNSVSASGIKLMTADAAPVNTGEMGPETVGKHCYPGSHPVTAQTMITSIPGVLAPAHNGTNSITFYVVEES